MDLASGLPLESESGGKLSSVEAGGASAGPFDDRYPESAWEVPGATVRHWVIDGHATDHALSITPR